MSTACFLPSAMPTVGMAACHCELQNHLVHSVDWGQLLIWDRHKPAFKVQALSSTDILMKSATLQ
jgi:hypothetical protein